MVRQWTTGELVERQKIVIKRLFKPIHDTELVRKKFAVARKADWFKEKEKAMNYDFHFDPSNKTRKYYQDWAAAKGLRIEAEEVVVE